MSAEDLVMELREAAERVQTEPSGDQAAAPLQSSSTSPSPVSAVDLTMRLRLSVDLFQGLADGALADDGCWSSDGSKQWSRRLVNSEHRYPSQVLLG